MGKVLEYFREQDPQLATVPDGDLVRYIGDRHPEFFQDAQFQAEWYGVVQPPSLATAILAPGQQSPGRPPAPDVNFPADSNRAEFETAYGRQKAERIQAGQGQPDVPIGQVGELEAAKQLATTPLLDIARPVTTEDLTTLGVPERPAKVLAGAQQGVASAVNFFTSPLGIATLGLGTLPKAAQQAVSVAFLGDMVRQTPEIYSGLVDAVGRGDLEGAAKWTTTGALDLLFAGQIARELASSPKAKAAEAIGRQLLENVNDPALAKLIQSQVESQAVRALSPRAGGELTPRDLRYLATTRPPVIEEQAAPSTLVVPELLRAGRADLDRLAQQLEAARVDGNRPEMERVRAEMIALARRLEGIERPAIGLEDLGGEWTPTGPQPGTSARDTPTPFNTGYASPRGEPPTISREQAPSAAQEPSAESSGVTQEAAGQVEPAAPDIASTTKPAQARVTTAGETITGGGAGLPDEGKASGMPAEPSPRTGPQPKSQTKGEERPWDLIDEISANIGKLRGLKSAAEGEAGYYPDTYRESLKFGSVRELYSNRPGTQSLDSAVDALRRRGVVGQDFSVDDLHEALSKAARARKAFRSGRSEESLAIKTEQAQRVDFERLAFRSQRSPTAKGKAAGVGVNDLLPGDEFTLAGAKVHVKELVFDPETTELAYVVLEDGRRFGVQTVGAEQVIHPDAGSLKTVERPTDFLPEEPGQPARRPSTEINRELNALRSKPSRSAFEEQHLRELEAELGQQDLLNVPASRTPAEIEAAKVKARQDAELAARRAQRLTGEFSAQSELLPSAGQQDIFSAGGGVRAMGAANPTRQRPNSPQIPGASRAPGGVSGSGGVKTPPGAPAPLRGPTAAPRPLPTSAVPPARPGAIRSWWQSTRSQVLKVVAPQAMDSTARRVANIVREYNAEAALRVQQADEELAKWRRSFDTTPVSSKWVYDPTQPLPRNYAFMDESERGGAALNPKELILKRELDQMLEDLVDDVHDVAPKVLQSLYQDYFPHLWKDPEQATRVFNSLLAKHPLEGSKTFLKRRTKRYFRDGIEAGLVPASDNPIDMVLLKMHELRRFIMAQKVLAESKAIGARKFVYVFERPPEGWTRVDDPSTAVHGPPTVRVQEAFDAQLRTKTLDLLAALGVPHERLMRMKGRRWGEADPTTGEIRTRFAGPDEVIWHELGHQLEWRYKMSRTLADTPVKQAELRALANARTGGAFTSAKFRRYIQDPDEKMATVVQAYLHAPGLLEQLAPTVLKSFRELIQAHPELHPINEIKPSLQLGVAKGEVPVGGLVTLGHWYMPEGAAAVLNNFISPGLTRFGLFSTLRQSSNLLNGMQLGFSAFHLGFTSLDATVSRTSVALQYLSDGRPIKAAWKALGIIPAPVTNYITGRRVQREMLRPGTHNAEVAQIAQLAVTGGLRATVDPFWKTEFSRKMKRAFYEGGVRGYSKTVLNFPFALVEQLIRPITEFVVPQQKLGVFADMARLAMDRLGPNATHEQVREEMAKAADSTENRMGQMTYDNLFFNRVLKDVALLGFRAFGWQLGKYREALGAGVDTIEQLNRLAHGHRPVLTNRMAYAIALPMVVGIYGAITQKLLSGKDPESSTDLYFPRTGKVDANGREQRVMLPAYLKDLISDWHDFPSITKMGASFYHKLNPWVAVTVDMWRNKDFYGVRIYNEDDPRIRQAWDLVKFAARSAIPFSVSGAQKLHEDPGAGATEWVLPFFGVVPAKRVLTMTPAEALASDIMAASMPVGSRTREQFERSKLIKQLAQEIKQDRAAGEAHTREAAQSGAIRVDDISSRIIPRLTLTPMQYQIRVMKPEDAMRVWDLANPSERAELRDQVLLKLARSKTLDPETLKRYVDVVVGNKTK